MESIPVRLQYGLSENSSPGGGVTGVNNTIVRARVKNIAFEKHVTLHHALSDGSWHDEPLVWQKNFGDHDVFERSDNTFVTARFAISFTSGGHTFWDNNLGVDYRLSETRPNTVGDNVSLKNASAHRGLQAGGGFTVVTGWVEGEILVKNLSFNKRVGVRLSADDWLHFQDTDALFVGFEPTYQGQSQVELWRFKTPELNLSETQPDFVFAIYYNASDTGEWFWDNNFDSNYRLSKAAGAVIE